MEATASAHIRDDDGQDEHVNEEPLEPGGEAKGEENATRGTILTC